jgi:hypothetical protein
MRPVRTYGSEVNENLQDIPREMEQRSTSELVSILRNRDEDEWRPEVFQIVATILSSRGISQMKSLRSDRKVWMLSRHNNW